MIHDRNGTSLTRPPSRCWLLLISAAVALGGTGCSGLFDIDEGETVTAESLDNALGAEALRIGALGRFTGAWGSQVTLSGAMADEFFATSVGSALAEANERTGTGYPYAALQQARINSLDAIHALQRRSPESGQQIAELFALAGYAELFLAENVCRGVPLSRIVDGRPEYGQPLSLEDLLARSVASFDSALVWAGGTAPILDLARVGKGRALLQLGQFTAAAAAVSAVPTNFAYQSNHSETEQRNAVFQAIAGARLITVADREGSNGLDFRSANDPRVPTLFIGTGGLAQPTPVYNFGRYPTASAPKVLASGIEARLIEAEAAFHSGGGTSAWLDRLNELRASQVTSPLPPLDMPTSDGERVDLLFRERAFWLFGTGHRHGDLRRLIRQYGRQAETVFPMGDFREGRSYRADIVVFEISGESANPNFERCLSLGA